ncbi:peptidase M17 [Arsukibacterium ikkense]|uniref:Probable cytosol aminopeptidase n=1 Tax=Arsukibacterium ikkense TaxID=336831 RepID=A0A0M2V624_9GAMM|nr:peptidase M17 [Arsukibacterium ikkense]
MSFSSLAITPQPFLQTKVQFSQSQQQADILVLLVPEKSGELNLTQWSRASRTQINRAIQVAEFTGKSGSKLEIIAPVGLDYGRIVLLGVGEPAKLSRAKAEEIGASLSTHVNATSAKRVHVNSQLISDTALNTSMSTALAHGMELRNYRFDRFKSKPEARPAQQYSWQVADVAASQARYQQLHALAQGVFTARELTNLPGSNGYPEAFANYAHEVLAPLGVKVTILGPEQVKALGMGSLYGVSQGSDKKAHLLIAHWPGAEGQPIALVGKGNTFDTGGYNLKTAAASILRMQTDKAGGAAVVGAIQALAGQQAAVNVVGVVPLSINMISGDAQLPGDVVTAGDGSTIEVGNTDAEGRLILADGIWYAREHLKARAIVDIATLTGAKVGALGSVYSAVFTEHSDIEQTLHQAGELVQERVWRLPLAGYETITKSRIADRINTGSPGAQAGAIFLKHFAGDTPWAHIDMAGDAFSDSAKGIHPEGANGYGVRLLTEWVQLYQQQAN